MLLRDRNDFLAHRRAIRLLLFELCLLDARLHLRKFRVRHIFQVLRACHSALSTEVGPSWEYPLPWFRNNCNKRLNCSSYRVQMPGDSFKGRRQLAATIIILERFIAAAATMPTASDFPISTGLPGLRMTSLMNEQITRGSCLAAQAPLNHSTH